MRYVEIGCLGISYGTNTKVRRYGAFLEQSLLVLGYGIYASMP
jgi:hypothetical protein